MRIQSRILLLFLASLLAVLGVTLITVSQVTYRHTLDRAQEELLYARRIFVDKLAARQRALVDAAKTLVGEDGLRQSIFDDANDSESLRVALDNTRRRTSADLAFLVTLDGKVLSDTASAHREGTPFPFPELLAAAATAPTSLPASQNSLLDGVAYQLVAKPYNVPVSALQPTFWLVVGRALDDNLARELRDLMGTDVALLAGDLRGGVKVLAS
jgi:hypothetical protein